MIDTFTIRCSILRAAFLGKLSQHEQTDESINELLKRVNPKKNIQQKTNTPYDIPDYWAWVKLSDLYTINPKVEAEAEIDAAFIPMERINAGFSTAFSYETQKWATASKNHTRFVDNDVAFAKITPCFENRKSFIATGLPNGIGGGTTELIILRQKEMYTRYTYYLILDQRFIDEGTASYKGMVGQQRVKNDIIKNYMVPVPPFEEQRRIVEKIDSILSVLDNIDTLQFLYSKNILSLKNKIIDAAIQGKLTEHLPEDGTAEELFQQIQQEKAAMEKAGKIKKSKPLPSISSEEKPFDIPENWKWVRLDEITMKISSGNTPSGGKKSDVYVDKGFCFFREQNIYNDGIRSAGMVYISEQLLNSRENSTVIAKDILLNITGGSIGRCAIIPDDFTRGSINQHILIIRMVNETMRFYIHAVICSDYVQQYIKKKAVGDKDGFSGGRCKSMPIPLPPLAEQKRIVAKLEELLPLCEE